MKVIISSWDEDYNFVERAQKELGKKLEKYIKDKNINFCNDEVVLIVEILKK